MLRSPRCPHHSCFCGHSQGDVLPVPLLVGSRRTGKPPPHVPLKMEGVNWQLPPPKCTTSTRSQVPLGPASATSRLATSSAPSPPLSDPTLLDPFIFIPGSLQRRLWPQSAQHHSTNGPWYRLTLGQLDLGVERVP